MGPAHKIIASCAVALLASVSSAESTSQCQPRNYTEFVKCASGSSIDIRVIEKQLESASKLEGVAEQWVNPELEADSVWKGSEKSETTAALLFNLRLGGKKSALISEARSEMQRARASRDLGTQQVRLEIMLALYRMSHLQSEIKIEEESVATFTKIVGQFQGRPARSPEQEVALSVFRMAQADHQLRLTKLRADQEKLTQALIAQTGMTRESILASLPARKETWPDLPTSAGIDGSPQVREAEADLAVAKSQQARAESEAWPDLKVGPAFRSTKDGADSNSYVGVAVAFPLPVFSLNQGAKAYQAQKVIETDLALQRSKVKVRSERDALANRYTETVRNLKSTLSLKALVDKHEQLERQFFKGLVTSALVIEAHRQLFDFEQRRNESELEALEAYGQLAIINNSFDGVIL